MTPDAEHLAEFIRTILIDPSLKLEATTPLISSGILDSYSLVEVILQVEKLCGVKLPPAQRTKEQLDTIALILATVDRLKATPA